MAQHDHASQLAELSLEISTLTRWVYSCIGVLCVLLLIGFVFSCCRYRPRLFFRRVPSRAMETGTKCKTVDLEEVPDATANVYEPMLDL